MRIIQELLLHEKHCKILLHLRESGKQHYCYELAKAAGTSYLRTSELLHAFERAGLVEIRPDDGKIRPVLLTPAGRELAGVLATLKQRLDAAKVPPVGDVAHA